MSRRQRRALPQASDLERQYAEFIGHPWFIFTDAIGPTAVGVAVGVYYGPLWGFIAGIAALPVLIGMVIFLPKLIGTTMVNAGRFGFLCAVILASLAGVFALGRETATVGGRTARIARLEGEVSGISAPRNISQAALDELISSLRSSPAPTRVGILGVTDSYESRTLKDSLESMCQRLGWVVWRKDGGMGTWTGIQIGAAPGNPTAEKINSALQRQGLQSELRNTDPSRSKTPEEIKIWVGMPDPTYRGTSRTNKK